MAGSTAKKVLILRFDRESLTGFVNHQTYLASGGVELLTPSGSLSILPYEDVKAVCFVKDFEIEEPSPQRLFFASRPKSQGLWVRMQFRDGDCMEGLLANDLLQLEAQGFTVVPPEGAWNSQRMFIPKAALSGIQVLGVVGSALRRHKPLKGQLEMFE